MAVSDIGLELVRMRRAQGLSQARLAALVGVKRQQIQRWESTGYRTASLQRVDRVAAALGWRDGAGATQGLIAAEPRARYGAAFIERATEPARDLGDVIARIREHSKELRDRFQVVSIDVFGSFARGEQTDASDVDLVVEVEHPSMETVFGAQGYLQALLGRKTQTGSLGSLRPRVRSYVEREKVHAWSA